ncbi:hypothetical protein VTK26DRAFT_1073 [Humicola hyalothermophila]
MSFELSSHPSDKMSSWVGGFWIGDPNGDMVLEFEGYQWKVKEDIIAAHFKWLDAAFPDRLPGSHIVFSGLSGGTSPQVFSALLEFLHTNQFGGQLWEPFPSFFTYVEAYFAADCLGVKTLKDMMVERIEALSWQIVALRGAHSPLPAAEERKHLESFVIAVVSVERRKWSAKIQKAMYDAGERLKYRLIELSSFRQFVEGFDAGKDFSRAIGL